MKRIGWFLIFLSAAIVLWVAIPLVLHAQGVLMPILTMPLSTCPIGYQYQGTFTPPTPASTLTNFTIYVSYSGTLFKTKANGGAVQNTVADPSASLTVPADLVIPGYKWGFMKAITSGGSDGTGVIRVLIPSLSSGGSSPVTYCLGNASVSTYQGGTIGQDLDTSTVALYDLGGGGTTGTTVNLADFSSNANTGVNEGGLSVTGSFGIDGGTALTTTGSTGIGAPAITALQFGGQMTVSALINMNIPATTAALIIQKRANATEFPSEWEFFVCCNASSPATLLFEFYNSGYHDVISTATFTTGANHCVAMTLNSSGSVVDFYIDGGTVDAHTYSSTILTGSNPIQALNFFGYSGGNSDILNGTAANIRVDNTARSANWLSALCTSEKTGVAMSTPIPN